MIHEGIDNNAAHKRILYKIYPISAEISSKTQMPRRKINEVVSIGRKCR